MIDVTLADKPVNISGYIPYTCKEPSVFLGFIVRNEYDNRRLYFNPDLKPQKLLFGYNSTIVPMYGLLLPLRKEYNSLCEILKLQNEKQNLPLSTYINILSQFDLQAGDSYSDLMNGVYPIDFKYFDKITDSDLTNDKKILQHIIGIDESKFDFQKFASLKLFILN
jgi:hypothetical protein